MLILIALLALVYFLGPRVEKPELNPDLPELTTDLLQLENEINSQEESNEKVKIDNQSTIVWFDSIPKKTKYSFVYFHGWSASHEEGAPLHRQMAKRYGANLYLPRLAGHGLNEGEPMLNLTATDYLNSAKRALAVAKTIGEKVIVMGTSTGGTIGLWLASEHPDIEALLLYSPNVEIYDSSSKLLSGPWGLQLVRLVQGGDYFSFKADSIKRQYWTTKYRVEALTHLQALIDDTMNEDVFGAIKQPVFMGYYYRDEENQDKVVSVSAMLDMYGKLGTKNTLKSKQAFANVNDHVMTSHITSKDFESVKNRTIEYLEATLSLKPIKKEIQL
ncbi:alpha/beta hydrolase [Spongiivirga citrea]|uniref:alpha/beta hydrolase n=1 Tax=Spongiivirga citrea TaxID=1481457 RepID=UPI001953B000|nr:alpha/beta hydrolase [Spongiivirga citrea]